MRNVAFYMGAALVILMLVLMLVSDYHPNDRRWKKAATVGLLVFFGFAVIDTLIHIRDWEPEDFFDSVIRFLYLLPLLILVQKKDVRENRKFKTLWRVTAVLLIVFLILLFLWAAFLK